MEDSDIIQYGGNYFLVLSTEPTDDEKTSVDQVGELNANIPQGNKLLVNQYDGRNNSIEHGVSFLRCKASGCGY